MGPRVSNVAPSLGLRHLCNNGGTRGIKVISMKDKELLERLVLDPKIMVGKPVIKGTRLTVDHVLKLLAHGSTVDEILEEYQGIGAEDVQACLLFATRSLADTAFMPLVEGDP